MKAQLFLLLSARLADSGMIGAYDGDNLIAHSTLFWLDHTREARACVAQMTNVLRENGYTEIDTNKLPDSMKQG